MDNKNKDPEKGIRNKTDFMIKAVNEKMSASESVKKTIYLFAMNLRYTDPKK